MEGSVSVVKDDKKALKPPGTVHVYRLTALLNDPEACGFGRRCLALTGKGACVAESGRPPWWNALSLLCVAGYSGGVCGHMHR
jgi:hypothetical protein